MIRSRVAPCLAVWIALLSIAVTSRGEASIDISWPRDQFWISGHAIGNVWSRSRYRLINDAGIDLLHHGDKSLLPDARAVAYVLQDEGVITPGFDMKGILNYWNAVDALSNNPTGYCSDPIDQLLTDIDDLTRPSVLGYVVWDEPCRWLCKTSDANCDGEKDKPCFAHLEAVAKVVLENEDASGRLPYVNLLPIHSSCIDTSYAGADDAARYRDYLDAYLSLFDGSSSLDAETAPILSIDQYPFESGSFTKTDAFKKYFLALRLVAERAALFSTQSARIPMWVVVQVTQRTGPGPLSSYTKPTFEQVRWQVYSSVAYGAKGIAYWTLVPRGAPAHFDADGILDANGDEVDGMYDEVQALNADLHTLGPTLMDLDPVAVFHQSDDSMLGVDDFVLTNSSRYYNFVESITQTDSGEDGMAGFFIHRTTGDEYLLVVNKDWENQHSFKVNFQPDEGYYGVERVNKSDGSLTTVSQGGTDYFDVPNLGAGDAELYLIHDQPNQVPPLPRIEYIQDENETIVSGDRTYFACDAGLVLVNASNGFRAHVRHDGVHIPVTDIEVHAPSGRVSACFNNGQFERAYDLDLNVVPHVSDLDGGFAAQTSFKAIWTAPTHAGGTTQYDLRYSTSDITTEAEFNAATQVTNEPTPAAPGTIQNVLIGGLDPCRTYYFAMKSKGACGPWSDLSNTGSETTTPPCIFEEGAELQTAGPLSLEPLEPNPIQSRATVRFVIPTELEGKVFDISAYDVSGRRVSKIAAGSAEPGRHSIEWDLRQADGSKVRAGMYFVRLRLGEQSKVRSILVTP